MDDFVGRTILDYEIRERIGQGGHGMVYKAYEPAVNREVAVKVIIPTYVNEPEFAQRFEIEAQLVAQLEHPHIVPLYRYWHGPDGAYIVMRLVKGGSLRDLLHKHGPLPIVQISRLLEQITDALLVAHEAGVIHRDLKTDNILLDERGNAYLTDFGIAKQVRIDRQLTQSDALIGTFIYLAPEQLEGRPATSATDVYALGLVLYEMLTGEHPFAGISLAAVMEKKMHGEIPSVIEKRPDLSGSIDQIIECATAKEPSERYEDARSLSTAFREATNLPSSGTLPQPKGREKQNPNPTRTQIPSVPEARNRYYMLQNVRKFWIEGVLENSLHGAALIELGMDREIGTVEHAWDTLLRLPEATTDKTVPPGTQILDIFDKLNGKILILGDPGSGKTTTLLELARDLLGRAELDNEHPIPVVFNLSSWSENRKLLSDWLIEELNSKYQVPKKVAQTWVESDALLLLLDGLDEVAIDFREACVAAINTYREEHGFVDIVVCSRLTDYSALANRLKLNGAIILQHLNDRQIDTYLSRLGPAMNTVRSMLQEDAMLQELSRSPLMLSILALAYQGVSRDTLPEFESAEAQRRHIFSVYVERMFARRAERQLFSQEQTIHYLEWLAKQMLTNTQSLFLIEKMQPDWLTRNQRQRFFRTFRLTLIPLAGLIQGIPFYFIGLGLGVSGWLLSFLLMLGGAISILIFTKDYWQRSSGRVIWGLAYGLPFGITIGLAHDLAQGLTIGAGIGIASALGFGQLRASLNTIGYKPERISPIELLRFSWKRITLRAVAIGAILGAILVIVIALIWGSPSLDPVRLGAAIIGGALISGSVFLFQSGVSNTEVEQRTYPNQGIRSSFINAGRVYAVTLIGYVLFGILGIVPITSWTLGLVIGFGLGLPAGFADWVAYGGLTVVQHLGLRRILYTEGAIPRNYEDFLDYATDLIFLRKVGGGYIFIHRYLMEHFGNRES